MKTVTQHELDQKRRETLERRHTVRFLIVVALFGAGVFIEMSGYFEVVS